MLVVRVYTDIILFADIAVSSVEEIYDDFQLSQGTGVV